ncbi:MAG TPA: 3-methyl-2-oxobutanoate hydroxymethyltransferase [Acidimicrobiia bacterium]|nr:3-methyl-2-oxobutanoate hydroxymethyltransferase [Acidimicrobiia bacterium]
MPRILDHTGREADRTVTVESIRALRGTGDRYTQVTAGTEEEAAAAEAAGIEMVVCLSQAVPAVRRGSSRLFVTAAIDFDGAVSLDDLLATALDALTAGADAVITARRLATVSLLADEEIPVMGHLGFVPKQSTLHGGVRAVGKTAAEAATLWSKFQRLQDAGAFTVECELIPANVMGEIHRRTEMVTISLGSGPEADVMFLFQSDICGEGRVPRHARAYADLPAMYARIHDERVRALRAYRTDVLSGSFPNESEVVMADDSELAGFLEMID